MNRVGGVYLKLLARQEFLDCSALGFGQNAFDACLNCAWDDSRRAKNGIQDDRHSRTLTQDGLRSLETNHFLHL